MSDPFYPTIDLAFIEEQIISCDKVISDSKIKIGNTTAFVLHGKKAMHRRIVLLRELNPNEITFEMATGVAIRLKFMGNLLKWLEVNKKWKDGAYFV